MQSPWRFPVPRLKPVKEGTVRKITYHSFPFNKQVLVQQMESSSLNQLNELKEIQVQNSLLFLPFFQESLNGTGANLATDPLKRKQKNEMTSAELSLRREDNFPRKKKKKRKYWNKKECQRSINKRTLMCQLWSIEHTLPRKGKGRGQGKDRIWMNRSPLF